MIDEKNVRISYTSNEIGSGHYCECNQELTHDEYRDYRYKKVCGHVHKKEKLISMNRKWRYV